jgi:hypothetical protein
MSKRAAKVTDVCFDLKSLCDGIPALTPAMGQVHAECAAVCLAKHGHGREVAITIKDIRRSRFSVKRIDVTDVMRRTYADLQDATELGACGIAILVISHVTGFTAIERSFKRTGFDYWLGPPSAGPLFQKKARLEASGILEGSDETVKYRLTQKLNQMARSDAMGLPGYAVIVEFGLPRADFAKK